ncbi:MAG: DHA2 family efflux MFS transporter permease subunit [Gammaproteobacteria bacterium]|nr:DHA2 family efflux MFS transporter permease subunit [Gammaproteobacteria bacterium]
MAEELSPSTPNRGGITLCVMLATLMQSLDTTIANVALPHMQGSLAASQDQIDWVLTSYIVAAAIATPLTGFLTARLGLKQLFIASVVGFTVASMLCGMATSVTEIVLFRWLQGLFGAALVPLSQTVLLNINPPQRHGSAMAAWGMAVMAAPILGPVLGGWLTEDYSWRWVFYINLPIGVLTFIGMVVFLPAASRRTNARLDWTGFVSLSIAIAALQVMLDRGQELDWLASKEIVAEAIIAGSAFYIFLVQIFTAREPFLRPALFRDRNFTAGVLFVAIVGLTFYASLALQPPYLQDLMNYPVITAGLVMGPRGIGTMGAMMIVGKLMGRTDTRLLLAFGLGLSAWSFYLMTGWTPDVSSWAVIWVGVIQGVGLGFLFTPLSVVSLATLPPAVRPEGAGFYNLARNVGSSIGISIVGALLTRTTQANHAAITQYVTAVNPQLGNPAVAQALNPLTASGRAALDALITQQAQVIAYVDDYKFLMIATLAVIPLLIVFQGRSNAPSEGHSTVAEI